VEVLLVVVVVVVEVLLVVVVEEEEVVVEVLLEVPRPPSTSLSHTDSREPLLPEEPTKICCVP